MTLQPVNWQLSVEGENKLFVIIEKEVREDRLFEKGGKELS